MRKQYITEKGKAWAGITIDDEKMLELTTYYKENEMARRYGT